MVCDELAGLHVRLVDGTTVYFVESDEEDGDGGVREPRRPSPKKPSPVKANHG